MDELAVFPLPIVVFPGMTVPLQIYEERYKRLVRHAAHATPARFLIAPPPDGADPVQAAGRPGDVGTLVEVLELTEHPDGTFGLLAHGRERRRLGEVREERVAERDGGERALWFARSQPWPLERGDPNSERIAAWDAVAAFRRYGEVFFTPQARAQAESALPSDPLYQASFVCANLRLSTAEAQKLLEAPSLSARFEAAKAAIAARLAEGREADAEADGDGLAAELDAELAGDAGEAFAEELEAELEALLAGEGEDPDDSGDSGESGGLDRADGHDRDADSDAASDTDTDSDPDADRDDDRDDEPDDGPDDEPRGPGGGSA